MSCLTHIRNFAETDLIKEFVRELTVATGKETKVFPYEENYSFDIKANNGITVKIANENNFHYFQNGDIAYSTVACTILILTQCKLNLLEKLYNTYICNKVFALGFNGINRPYDVKKKQEVCEFYGLDTKVYDKLDATTKESFANLCKYTLACEGLAIECNSFTEDNQIAIDFTFKVHRDYSDVQ